MADVELPNGELGRPIPGFPGYVATVSGKIWSNRRRGPGTRFNALYVEVTGGVDKDGYRKLILSIDGVRYYKRTHLMILWTFRGECPPGHEGRHLNGKRQDNRLKNLVWSTHIENIADKKRHGTHQCGEKNPAAKHTEAQARHVKRGLARGESPAKLATRLGVPRHFVSNIKYGRRWKHVKV